MPMDLIESLGFEIEKKKEEKKLSSIYFKRTKWRDGRADPVIYGQFSFEFYF